MPQIDQLAAQVAHSVDIQKLANSIASGHDADYDKLAKVIRDILLEHDVIATKKLLTEIIKEVTEEVTKTTASVTSAISSSVAAATQQEINFQYAVLNAITSIAAAKPKYSRVETEIINTPLVLEKKAITWNDRIGGYSDNTLEQITSRIIAGWSHGDTTADISRSIIGNKTTKGLIDKTKASTNTMVKDLLSHSSSVTKARLAKDNKSLVIGEKTIVTLDNRTSPICQHYGSEDKGGKEWVYEEVGNNFPRPPFHWRCRSTNIYLIDPAYDLNLDKGTRPAVVDGKAIQVAADTNWFDLAKKHKSIAEQALGKSRAKLLDNMSAAEFNKIAFDSLGEQITLDEMIANSKKVASLLK
jgi:uncharacterized protein YejL (UPF0352 family)